MAFKIVGIRVQSIFAGFFIRSGYRGLGQNRVLDYVVINTAIEEAL